MDAAGTMAGCASNTSAGGWGWCTLMLAGRRTIGVGSRGCWPAAVAAAVDAGDTAVLLVVVIGLPSARRPPEAARIGFNILYAIATCLVGRVETMARQCWNENADLADFRRLQKELGRGPAP